MTRTVWLLVLAALALSGCSTLSTPPASPGTVAGNRFILPNDPAQPPWQSVAIRFKTPTDYSRAEIDGVPCVLAQSSATWSLHAAAVPSVFASASTLSWRWNANNLPAGADSEIAGKDDAAARVLVAFRGDRSKLDALDRSAMNMAKLIGGWEIPFASLQYIWEADAKPEAVIPHHTVSRIKKIVVRSGEPGLRQWLSFERNVREDFRRAFAGEEPGEIESIGIMTDTDSLGGTARTCYADLVLR